MCTVRSIRWSGSCLVLVGLAGTAVAVSCCPDRNNSVSMSQERSQMILAAARQHQISMFGDLPDGSDVGYFTRTAMSLRQHTFTEVGADFDVSVAPSGERFVFASTRHHAYPDLYIKSVQGVSVTQLTSDPASDIQPAFSPDDTRIAFSSNRGGNWDIWVIHVEGGPPVQVTHGPADDLHPSWSPDGSQIVYCSLPARGGQWELWIADARTSATRKFIGYGLFPQWSPSGQAIVYQRARERGSRWFSIWTLSLVGGEPRYPTEVTASSTHAMILPVWSKDGRRIAYVSTQLSPEGPSDASESTMSQTGIESSVAVGETPFDIWVIGANGSGKIRLTDGHTINHAPAFSSDGHLFFVSKRSGHENIWSLMPGGPAGMISADGSITGVVGPGAGLSRAATGVAVVNDDL